MNALAAGPVAAASEGLLRGVVRKVLEKIHEAGAQNVGMGTEEQK